MTSSNDGAGGLPLLADAAIAVDLALVLAVDCSSSVDAADFRLEMDGFAAALRNPALQQAIAAGAHGRIAVTLFLWSNAQTQVIALPWRIVATASDLELMARQIEVTERKLPPGGTGLAAAIDYAADLLAVLPVAANRHEIDVSGDGEDNESGDTAAARDRAVARGITINGLPVTSGSKLLVTYYRDQVIGGAGAFIEPAETVLHFRDSILRKLLREIGRPVS